MSFLKQRALALWSEAQRFQSEGRLDKAIDLYTKSIGIYPTAEGYTFRGWAYSFQKRLHEAIEECKKAIEIDPSFGNAYNDIGTYLMALGELDAAVEWFEKAKVATRYEARHYPYMNLGRLFAFRGMLLKAIAEFEAALMLCPGEPTCLASLNELKGNLH